MTHIPDLDTPAARLKALASPRLERAAFRTSRLLDFVDQRELTAQIGHGVADWPLVVLKELVDNALDSTEEAGAAPEISVSVSTNPRGSISVADNGAGIPIETIAGILDYTVRISSRETYVSPTRGAQGNALKTLLDMPFALDGEQGETVSEAQGAAHRISFAVDRVRQEPRINRTNGPSPVNIGTRITLAWPDSASSILDDVRPRFLQIADDFHWLNPHLRLSVDWDGERVVDVKGSDPAWRKWLPSEPTSAHWYDTDRLVRYMAAHVAGDQDLGRDRSVREFIAEFRGLSGSAKQKLVLDASGTTRTPLSSFLGPGETSPGIVRLLQAMQVHTRKVKPRDLGVIAAIIYFSGSNRSASTKKPSGTKPTSARPRKDCLPSSRRRSAGARKGWRHVASSRAPIGQWRSVIHFVISGVAAKVSNDCWLISAPRRTNLSCCSFTWPPHGFNSAAAAKLRSCFRDQTMKTLNIADSIISSVENVTKDWARQRKAEERDRSRAAHRYNRLVREDRITILEAAWMVMDDAYAKASDNGRLPVRPRQIMYTARPDILEMTGKDYLDDRYFTQILLPDYLAANPECRNWDIVWDARGHFTEPHTGREIGLGTLEIRDYLGLRLTRSDAVTVNRDVLYPTSGPEYRFNTILFVEKEGFDPLSAAEHLSERYDLAIMSTKGMSVTASRLLLDRLTNRGIERILVLHDFDISGFSILGTLGTSNRRYGYQNRVPLIDIGLRLEDVEAIGVAVRTGVCKRLGRSARQHCAGTARLKKRSIFWRRNASN